MRFSDQDGVDPLLSALADGATRIFKRLKQDPDVFTTLGANTSGDIQFELDVWADDVLREALATVPSVGWVVSEELDALRKMGDGPWSVSLDPIDGSKSAATGMPPGSIFGVFKNATAPHQFCGANLCAAGFFIYGLQLELFVADKAGIKRFVYDDGSGRWLEQSLPKSLPQGGYFCINASNRGQWPMWLRAHYDRIMGAQPPDNLRWYASMVMDVKRLLLQGGVFAYPADMREGYENGHLRLVYEAIPMAFLVHSLGGLSSDGTQSLLDIAPDSLHQKSQVFLGEREKILALETSRNADEGKDVLNGEKQPEQEDHQMKP
ncbi:MAG: class 1 fructose-bisphosphatase [Pseudomonadota bacterium]